MAEVEAGEQGHMADDQPQRGVGDIQAGEPEINHVAEFTAIVLTCKKGEKMTGDYLFGIWHRLPALGSSPRATAYWVCLSEA